MQRLIDTSVAVWLRDGEAEIVRRIELLEEPPLLSVISRVELEGGLYTVAVDAVLKRRRLSDLLATVIELPFDVGEAEAYGRIVERLGFSRSRIIDRMIAAQAIVARARLVTINGDDFKTIPDLDLEVWPSPS